MSERIDTSELPHNSKTRECDCYAQLTSTELDVALEKGVREPSATPESSSPQGPR